MADADADVGRQCAACKQVFAAEKFSKKQWLARAYSRRCAACVEAGAVPQASAEQEELCALVKAVKFVEPHATVQRVCDEITAQLSKHGRAAVPHSAIHTAWASLGLDTPEDTSAAPLKVFTIGKSGSGVTSGGAGGVGGAAGVQKEGGHEWAPVLLDVGGVRDGNHPYQAVISHTSWSGGASHSVGGDEIFKIQTAGGLGLPMLCYNKARDKQTMVHDDTPGYARMHAMVCDVAGSGVTGPAAGRKAFFFGRPHPDSNKAVCLNISIHSPPQEW